MRNSDMDDLLNLAKAGDEKALVELYERYHKQAYYIALQICRNATDAQDIAQESMLEVLKSIHQLKYNKYFKLWFNKIVRSKCMNSFRKNRDVILPINDERFSSVIADPCKNPESTVRFSSDQEVIDYYVDKLEPLFRDVILRYYFKHKTMIEIAREDDIPLGTVKSRLNIGRQKLKSLLHEYEIRENVKIDFKSTALSTAFLSSTSLLEILRLKFQSSSYVLSITTLGIIAAVSTFLLLDEYHEPAQSPIQANMAFSGIRSTTSADFGPITYDGNVYDKAEDAYFALREWAHCIYEMKEKDNEEIKKIYPLYEELKAKNGVYWRFLKWKQWDKDFETILELRNIK